MVKLKQCLEGALFMEGSALVIPQGVNWETYNQSKIKFGRFELKDRNIRNTLLELYKQDLSEHQIVSQIGLESYKQLKRWGYITPTRKEKEREIGLIQSEIKKFVGLFEHLPITKLIKLTNTKPENVLESNEFHSILRAYLQIVTGENNNLSYSDRQNMIELGKPLVQLHSKVNECGEARFKKTQTLQPEVKDADVLGLSPLGNPDDLFNQLVYLESRNDLQLALRVGKYLLVGAALYIERAGRDQRLLDQVGPKVFTLDTIDQVPVVNENTRNRLEYLARQKAA